MRYDAMRCDTIRCDTIRHSRNYSLLILLPTSDDDDPGRCCDEFRSVSFPNQTEWRARATGGKPTVSFRGAPRSESPDRQRQRERETGDGANETKRTIATQRPAAADGSNEWNPERRSGVWRERASCVPLRYLPAYLPCTSSRTVRFELERNGRGLAAWRKKGNGCAHACQLVS
mmetsp:Transcript_23307/g.47549  ORF Transcript_23307/g.47549 Transcript_23307/m.47549 type:complete len:174 (+) Transcript_23307:1197-1718(+)